MITSLLNTQGRTKGVSIVLQNTHSDYATLRLEKKVEGTKAYDIFINESLFTLKELELNNVATHKIETSYFKKGQNTIKVIARDSQDEIEVYEESFYYNTSLKLRKIATGVTFYVFQWKRPKNSNDQYKFIFNKKKSTIISSSEIVLESVYVSNFVEGKNTIEVIAYTSNSDVRYTERLDFEHSF